MSKTIELTLPERERRKFEHWTDSLKDENKRECKMIIRQSIMNMARRAKMFAPVKTSFLKGSIHPAFTPEGFGGSVYTVRDYAPYVEFGTGNKVVAPADVADYAMTFKGKGLRKHNQRAQPYLFPAWRLAQKKMKEKLKAMGFNNERSE